MLKVLDIFRVGAMLSVTIEGECEKIANGSKLADDAGNIIIVDSVAMTRPIDPDNINEGTIILVKDCGLKIGSKLSIA